MAKIATPQQAQAALEQTGGFTDVKSGKSGRQNRMNTRPLTKFERESLAAPVDAVYLYNVSPIWKHTKEFKGLGTVTLARRKEDAVVSIPTIIERRMVRGHDGGGGIRRLMVETPSDIADDFLCISKEIFSRPENSLVEFGCFRISKPLEDLEDEERLDILDAAELKHRNKCREFVLHADALWNSQWRACVVEVHRKCALYLFQTEQLELPEWVSKRGKVRQTEECPVCAFENKRGVMKCQNCREVLDEAAYAKWQKSRESK